MGSLKGTGFWDWVREEEDHEPAQVLLGEGSAPIRRRFRFFGQVQGVGFRYVLGEAAEVFGLTGHAKNEEDGSVTAEYQGLPLSMENAVHYVQCLSPYILVDRIEVEELALREGESGFYTR